MKVALVVLASLLPGAAVAQVPAMPKLHSVSLEAQSVSSGGTTTVTGDAKTHTSLELPLGGSDTIGTSRQELHDRHDTSNRTNLEVKIRNFGPSPDTVTLEWYFVASGVGKTAKKMGGKDFVYDRGSKAVVVTPGVAETCLLTSKEAKSVITRSTSLIGGADGSSSVTFVGGGNARGSQTQTGVMLRGWFVRLVDGGRVLASRGSSASFEEMAADDAKLNALLEIRGPGGK